MQNGSEVSEVSIGQLLASRWRFLLACAIGFAVLAALITPLLPRRYESTMKFLVNNERADLVISPRNTATDGPRHELTEAEVNSEMELLRSQDILKSVVVDLHLYQAYEHGNRSATPSPRSVELAILKLAKNLAITSIHRTNVIQVTYKADDPNVAVSILRQLGDRYMEEHIEAHSAPGSYQFFHDKAETYAGALLAARKALNGFQGSSHLFSMPQQQSSEIDGLQSTQAQLNDVSVKLAEAHSRLVADHEQLLNTPDRVTTQVTDVPSQMAVQQLEATLTELRNRHISMVTKFQPGDRAITELEQQITSTESQLKQLVENPSRAQTTDVNPIHQSIQSEIGRSQVELDALEGRSRQLEEVRGKYLARLDRLGQDSITLQLLQQKEKIALDDYNLAVGKMEESQLAGSMDQSRLSNVSMVETPLASPIPVSPSLSINIAAGTVFGFLLAFGLVFYQQSRHEKDSLGRRVAEVEPSMKTRDALAHQ